MASFRLADLISPQPVQDFLNRTYSQSWAHYQGDRERFQNLATWTTLNEILSTQRYESPRFRLVRHGDAVPDEDYTEQVRNISGATYRYIVVERLLDQLRNGATLAIDRIEQAHDPVRRLASALESELRAPVFVNLFASWMPVSGFDLHWDDRDVFVIQLEGRKHWQIFGPTRKWPLNRDVVKNVKPEGDPIVDLEVTAGDVLYLPHGWWHLVTSVNEPSLHITVGVRPDDGIDFMTWLVDRARSFELFRGRIPRFGDDETRTNYLTSLRSVWRELLESDDIVEQFLVYSDGTTGNRPLYSLPDLFSESSVLQNANARIVLLVPRAVVTQVDNGLVLTALGRRWLLSLYIKPLIERILSHGEVTVGEALKICENVSDSQVADVIFLLLKAGVVALQ